MSQGFRLNVRLTPELFRMLQDLRLAMFAPTDSDVVRYLITEGYAAEYGAIERAKADKAARDARQLKLPAVELDDPFEALRHILCQQRPAIALPGPCSENIARPGKCVWCDRQMRRPTEQEQRAERAQAKRIADLAREYREVDEKERGAHEVAAAIRELQPKARKQRRAKK